MVIARCGEVNSHHWAHRRADCDPWSEPMSAWHLWWQRQFPIEQREVVIEREGVRHRADVRLAHGGVLELQASHLAVEDIHEREQFYGHMAWLFRCTWTNNLRRPQICRCPYCLATHPELHLRVYGSKCRCVDCDHVRRDMRPPPDPEHLRDDDHHAWLWPRRTLLRIDRPLFWHVEQHHEVWRVQLLQGSEIYVAVRRRWSVAKFAELLRAAPLPDPARVL